MDPRKRAPQATAAAAATADPMISASAALAATATAAAPMSLSSSSLSQPHSVSSSFPAAAVASSAPASILFSGEDAMEEDEAMPLQQSSLSMVTNDRGATVASSLATSAATTTTTSTTTTFSATDILLLSRIITPSPYPQHNAGPTSSRFRNALHRVTTKPTADVEAWQALLTEVHSCYRALVSNYLMHAVDAETQAKLDWIESCYGAVLKHFPYASTYYVTVVELLLAQSARYGEEQGPLMDNGMAGLSRRALRCEAKAEHIFRTVLGYNMDGTEYYQTTGKNDSSSSSLSPEQLLGGMCVWCVELWLLYIRKAIRDANRTALTLPMEDRVRFVREASLQAYETAIAHAAASPNNHLLWKQYLAFVRSWMAVVDPNHPNDHALAQQQMLQLRSIYQRLVTHPMTGLDQLWQEYELFERSQNEALAQALIQEFSPKYQHARTVYLERNRVYGAVDLELGRLGADPIEEESEEEYASKLEEEFKLLKVWKTRCSYERTNPERLASTTDVAQRIRHAYKQMVSVFTRHPECWHMWSMWELYGPESKRTDQAIAVLQRGRTHIPDCTLLAYAEAQAVELHSDHPANCIQVMEHFLERCPNSLGFILCQQMTRRYKGMDAARKVFARARRTLVDAHRAGGAAQSTHQGSSTTTTNGEGIETTKTDATGAAVSGGGGGGSETNHNQSRWIITNRLDPSVGQVDGVIEKHNPISISAGGDDAASDERDDESSPPPSSHKKVMGAVTWHLYASHAMMEHRLNRSPEIAARVYELGLRKHASFLTKPPYVTRYAQLLLELDDPTNLRALLTRAVAACEAQDKQSALGALWDLTLRFEAVLSMDSESAARLQDIERKRREAVFGADVEDVATGGTVGLGEQALIGAQKSTIGDQLARSEGYDISSKIVNGMGRSVDLLNVMGLWGNDAGMLSSSRSSKQDKDDEISGGKSDALFQKRLRYEQEDGMPTDSGAGEAGTKILSARERLQHASAASGAGPGQASAMMLAIQQSPEWLRPLLLLLPASRLRLPIVAKPPPHLTELALSSLRLNVLPAERPEDVENGSNKRKAADDMGNDSSDDENGGKFGGGYGTQFRSRQRSRMSAEQNGAA